jgi:hypothetical protein
MSPKVSVLIRKNSDEVIRVITNHYNMYNNEGAAESILSLFPAYLCYWELLWQHFLPGHLKLQLYQLRSFMYPHKKSYGNSLGTRSTPAHFTHNTIQNLCIQDSFHFHKILAQITESTRKHLPFVVI